MDMGKRFGKESKEAYALRPIAGALWDRWFDKRYMSFGEIGFSQKILSR